MVDDIRSRHRDALEVATSFVERVTAAHLARPTPCRDWDLRHLLDHMVGQHVGFARVVRDGEAPLSAYAPVPFSMTSWRPSVGRLVDAFAAADLETRVVEVELDSMSPLPIGFLVAAQHLDTVVHTWDVAMALGEPYVPPDDVADEMWRMAQAIPDDDRRERPGAAFAHGVWAEGSNWRRALAFLGRDGDWPSGRC